MKSNIYKCISGVYRRTKNKTEQTNKRKMEYLQKSQQQQHQRQKRKSETRKLSAKLKIGWKSDIDACICRIWFMKCVGSAEFDEKHQT